MGPAVTLVVAKIGYKWTGWLGALISIGSMGVCYFTDNFRVFQTCYGFLMGLGFSFLYLPSTTCGTFYFKERQALATRYTTLQILMNALFKQRIWHSHLLPLSCHVLLTS